MEAITGKRFTGRIEEGFGHRRRNGWITLQFSTETEVPDAKDACGAAYVGANPGHIWIYRRHRNGSKYCANHMPTFRDVLAHEVGHALGLFHVNDRNAVMHPSAPGTSFTSREIYHGRLLYRVGPVDWTSLAAAGIVVAGGALLACWLPARRALCLSPSAALRQE